MNATFVSKKKVALDIYRFYFKPDEPISSIAGQFIEIYLPHELVDDRGAKRWFTLSNSPEETLVCITTRIDPDISSSFKLKLRSLAPGDRTTISQAMGDFVLPIDQSVPLLFVAGGIGITPYLSILGHLLHSKEQRKVNLLYAVKSLDEAIDLESLKPTLDRFVLLDTSVSPLTAEVIFSQAAIMINHPTIYLSGPEKMVEQIGDKLISLGIDSQKLIRDFFPGYDVLE